MKAAKLTREDWLAAGFRALSLEGPAAIRVEALARDLKSTKGSFYWHFADLPSFKVAMLDLWREKVATEIIVEVMSEPNKHARLQNLAKSAAQPAPEEFGGRRIEPAMRAWALSDPVVLSSLEEMDGLRVSFIQSLLEDIGVNEPTLAPLLYGAYIGLDDLASKGRADIQKSLEILLKLMLK